MLSNNKLRKFVYNYKNMNNQEVADKIFDSYFLVTKEDDNEMAKKHANALIEAHIQLMFQEEDVSIIDAGRFIYLEDWEEIKYLINNK